MPLANYTIASPNGGTWTIQSTNSAQVGRYHDLALLMEGAVDVNQMSTSRPGIFVGSGFTGNAGTPAAMFAAASGSGLNLTVFRGAACVERGTLAGTYIVVSTAAATVTLATADATNPRIDRVDLH